MENESLNLAGITCGYCMQSSWKVGLVHPSNGTTKLLLFCVSEGCSDRRDEDGDPVDVLLEFDITGQGYDDHDIEKGRQVAETDLS